MKQFDLNAENYSGRFVYFSVGCIPYSVTWQRTVVLLQGIPFFLKQ